MSPRASSSTESLSARTHLDGADANVRFGESLAQSPGADATALGWAITALFYASVHETRAYLVARHAKRVVAHDDMRGLWDQHPEMRPAKAPYTELKQQSESARYYLNPAFLPEDFEYLKGRYSAVRSLLRAKTERAIQAADGE